MDTLPWEPNDTFETEDGYRGDVVKLDGVHLDGYAAEVVAPDWFYTARCRTIANAKSWCRHTVARDRRQPMKRPTSCA